MEYEKKYTPGPWRTTKASPIIRGKNGERVAKALEIDINTGEMEDANQALITSAPELLEALEALCAACNKYNIEALVPEYEAACSAIAKAYGEEAQTP